MSEIVKEELPDFLQDEIVYCDILIKRNHQRTCFALLKNLRFYEFQGKAAVNFIDLNGTCLSKRKQQIIEYKGKRGKCKSQPKNDNMQPYSSNQSMEMLKSDITFGKYIYQNFDIRKLYLLIKCWDKLIVLQHDETEDEQLVLKAEYENVLSFKLVHGKIKFQAAVEIKYQHGRDEITDFHDIQPQLSAETNDKTVKKDNFKQLLERIRSAKTELLVHKSLTQREFARLKTLQTFGCSYLRSFKLDERVLLARCGDVWMRLNSNDDLVIGVPLVNNSPAETCTVLKNIKPVFMAHTTLSYTFRLYQLQQQFSDLETLETFFQSENEVEPEAISWLAANSAQLVPESFAVLCIKLRLSEVITLLQTPFFIYFDIQRSAGTTNKEMLFNQQVFIKNLDFSSLLVQRTRYEISFKNSTLHQDFLAIAMAAEETSLALTFKNGADFQKFEKLLVERFDLKKLQRNLNDSVDKNNSANMEVEEEYVLPLETNDHSLQTNQLFAHSLFYNNQSASIWHGTLAIHCRGKNNKSSGIKAHWKFYTKTPEKAYVLLKLIFNELVLYKCNVVHIEFPVCKTPQSIQFENALRQELNYARNLGNEVTSASSGDEQLEDSIVHLFKLEMQTDLLAQTLT